MERVTNVYDPIACARRCAETVAFRLSEDTSRLSPEQWDLLQSMMDRVYVSPDGKEVKVADFL